MMAGFAVADKLPQSENNQPTKKLNQKLLAMKKFL